MRATTRAVSSLPEDTMRSTDTIFSGSIPEIYNRLLVPLIFEPYALDLAARLPSTARDILEVAAGTGVVTRAIAARLPRDARIVATDLNRPMLDYAARLLAGDAHVTWQQADALALPFADESVDTVVCQFGAMFFPNKQQAYREARRVLKATGPFLFNVWDRLSENDFPNAVTEALAALYPQNPPQFMARTPHGYFDVDRIRAELIEAGFRKISIDAVEKISRASSALDVAVAFCQGTPLRNEIEAIGGSGLEAATQAAAEELVRRYGDGPIEGSIKALVIQASA
jgi:ubiquinone/menaquinone biosynthesis C-methylase UbiE